MSSLVLRLYSDHGAVARLDLYEYERVNDKDIYVLFMMVHGEHVYHQSFEDV